MGNNMSLFYDSAETQQNPHPPTLPQEILDEIIDYFRDDPDTLKTLSVVSNATILRCRYYIPAFSCITFDASALSTPSRLRSLVLLLEKRNFIAPNVKKLRLVDPTAAKQTFLPPTLLVLFTKFLKLQDVVMYGLDLTGLADSRWVTAFAERPISGLDMKGCRVNKDTLFSLMRSMPVIRFLSFASLHVPEFEASYNIAPVSGSTRVATESSGSRGPHVAPALDNRQPPGIHTINEPNVYVRTFGALRVPILPSSDDHFSRYVQFLTNVVHITQPEGAQLRVMHLDASVQYGMRPPNAYVVVHPSYRPAARTEPVVPVVIPPRQGRPFISPFIEDVGPDAFPAELILPPTPPAPEEITYPCHKVGFDGAPDQLVINELDIKVMTSADHVLLEMLASACVKRLRRLRIGQGSSTLDMVNRIGRIIENAASAREEELNTMHEDQEKWDLLVSIEDIRPAPGTSMQILFPIFLVEHIQFTIGVWRWTPSATIVWVSHLLESLPHHGGRLQRVDLIFKNYLQGVAQVPASGPDMDHWQVLAKAVQQTRERGIVDVRLAAIVDRDDERVYDNETEDFFQKCLQVSDIAPEFRSEDE